MYWVSDPNSWYLGKEFSGEIPFPKNKNTEPISVSECGSTIFHCWSYYVVALLQTECLHLISPIVSVYSECGLQMRTTTTAAKWMGRSIRMGKCSSQAVSSSAAAQEEVSHVSPSAVRMFASPLQIAPIQGVWRSQESAARNGFVKDKTGRSCRIQWQVTLNRSWPTFSIITLLLKLQPKLTLHLSTSLVAGAEKLLHAGEWGGLQGWLLRHCQKKRKGFA